MSVVVGTSTGKVYLYSLKRQKLAAIRGEASTANRVVSLDFLDPKTLGKKQKGDLDFMFTNQKGELLFCSAEDELKTTGEAIDSKGLVSAQHFGRSVVLGNAQGELNLATIGYDKVSDIYSLAGNRRIFEDCPLPGLVNMKIDQRGSPRLACICQDKPPIVGIGHQGLRH